MTVCLTLYVQEPGPAHVLSMAELGTSPCSAGQVGSHAPSAALAPVTYAPGPNAFAAEAHQGPATIPEHLVPLQRHQHHSWQQPGLYPQPQQLLHHQQQYDVLRPGPEDWDAVAGTAAAAASQWEVARMQTLLPPWDQSSSCQAAAQKMVQI